MDMVQLQRISSLPQIPIYIPSFLVACGSLPVKCCFCIIFQEDVNGMQAQVCLNPRIQIGMIQFYSLESTASYYNHS